MSQQGSQGGGGGSRGKPTLTESLRELLTVDKQSLKAYAEFMSPFTVFYSFVAPGVAMLFAAIGAFPITFGYSIYVVPLLALIAIPMFVLALIATLTAPLLRVAASVEIRRGPVVILRPLYDMAILLTVGLPYALVWWWSGRLITLFFVFLDAVLVSPATLGMPIPPLPPVLPTNMTVLARPIVSAMVIGLLSHPTTSPTPWLQVLGINFTQIIQQIGQAAQSFVSPVISRVEACISSMSKPAMEAYDAAIGFAIEFFVIGGGYVLSRSRVIRGFGPINFVVGAAIISTLIFGITYYYAAFVSTWDCVYSAFTGRPIPSGFTMGDFQVAITDAGAVGTLILIYFIGQSLVKSMPGFPRRIPLSWNIVILLISLSAFAGTMWFAYAMVLVAIYLTFLWLASGDSTWFWYMVVLVPSAYFINLYLATVSSYLVSLFSSFSSIINDLGVASYDVFVILVLFYVVATIILMLPSVATTLSGINPAGLIFAGILIGVLFLVLVYPATAFAGDTIISSFMSNGVCIAKYLLMSPAIQLPLPTCSII